MADRSRHKRIHGEDVDKSQLRAFRKAARELGCDESEERFKETLRTVAKAKLSNKGNKAGRSAKE